MNVCTFHNSISKAPSILHQPQNNIIDTTVPILLCLFHKRYSSVYVTRYSDSKSIMRWIFFEGVFLHEWALMVLRFSALFEEQCFAYFCENTYYRPEILPEPHKNCAESRLRFRKSYRNQHITCTFLCTLEEFSFIL